MYVQLINEKNYNFNKIYNNEFDLGNLELYTMNSVIIIT